MTTLQKIQKLTWWNEIAKLKDILIDFSSAKESIDLRVTAIEDVPAPSGDFIPLSGTTVGNPVSGVIEVIEGVDFVVNGDGGNNINRIRFSEGDVRLSSEILGTGDTAIIVGVAKINIISSFSGSTGLGSNQNFSPNITDLDYPQKIYVDERGSIVNATTSVLSASDLTTQYPNAKDGFSVICPNIVGGGKYYIKAGASWYYQQILLVV